MPLKQKAKLLHLIRDYFFQENVLEVITPLMRKASNTDPFVESIALNYDNEKYYLQTSPELAMKHLLATDSQSIYQICKAFRKGDKGKLHNHEFTMLEWYRLGFDHHDLMLDVDKLLQLIFNCEAASKITYQDLFLQYADFNPHTVVTDDLINICQRFNILIHNSKNISKDDYLNLIFNKIIEPNLGMVQPLLVYDFPISQAQLAKITDNVANRFEVYFKGIELGNGFYELNDSQEQLKRFEKDNILREKLGKEKINIDFELIKVLDNMPDCAGVAIGLDRVLMLLLKEDRATF